MSVKHPDVVDHQVGQRVRARRVTLGMAQGELARALGVTFQQVQKYEKGTNRISAGRLQQIADALKAPVGYFYDRDDDAEGISKPAAAMSKDALTLAIIYDRIADPLVRRRVLKLVEAVAAEPASDRT